MQTSDTHDLWPDVGQGAAQSVTRASLFALSQQAESASGVKRMTVAAPARVTITYGGSPLGRDDELLFGEIASRCLGQQVGTDVEFLAGEMADALGWPIGDESHYRLATSLARMKGCVITIEVTGSGRSYTGSLVSSYNWTAGDGEALFSWTTTGGSPLQRCHVLLDRQILEMFPASA